MKITSVKHCLSGDCRGCARNGELNAREQRVNEQGLTILRRC